MKAIFLACLFFIIFQGSANATTQKLVGAVTVKNPEIVTMVIQYDTIVADCEAVKLQILDQTLMYVSNEGNGNVPNAPSKKASTTYGYLSCIPLTQ